MIIFYLRKLYEDSLIKNSIYMIMANFATLIFGFFFWVITTRYYTPYDVGIVSTIISCTMIISMISSMGFPTALLFYLPRYSKNANSMINSCMVISIAASFIFSIIFILGIDIWTKELVPIFGDIKILIIFFIISIATTISFLLSGVFIANKRSSIHMIKEAIFALIKIFPLIVFSQFGAAGILASWSIGLVIAIIIGGMILYKLWRYLPALTIDPIIYTMTKFSGGNYIATIFYHLPRFILPIMIINIISAESTAYFFVSITIATLLYESSRSISNSLLTEYSEGENLWNNVSKAVRFNLFILIPGFLLFVIFGKFMLNLFNPVYENAATTLIILAAASIPLSINIIFATVRNIQKRILSVIGVNMAVACMTIFLSIPLIEMKGIEGAAISYLLANTIVAAVIICKIDSVLEFTLKLLKGDKDVISI